MSKFDQDQYIDYDRLDYNLKIVHDRYVAGLFF